MTELSVEFEKETGAKPDVTYGSSGNFFSQIQNGAPFDLFFSADIEYPQKLEAAGLVEAGSFCQYAIGRIVIWVPAAAKVALEELGWKALLDDSVQKIAIANPEHAPYGRAGVAAMRKAGVYERLKGKLVYGENVSQAAQFVQSGNAQAGIIANSLALSPGMSAGKKWEIPADLHPRIRQGVVLMKGARNKQAALTFLEFVKSKKGREILAKNGFDVPFEVRRRKEGNEPQARRTEAEQSQTET